MPWPEKRADVAETRLRTPTWRTDHMVAAIRRVSRPLLACVLAFAALMASAGPAAASKAQYEKAYALGLEAYTYGLPLLETNKTFLTQTSINVSNGNGYGPVNQFNSVRNLTNP